jgi:quercetin dioxygenase-like cupin family protein
MSTVMPQSRIRYVYDFSQLDCVPAGPCSARVDAKRLLSGATLQTGKSSTVGAVLTGTHLIVTLGRQARGSGARAHTHPNEQINYIVQGVMTGEIEGEEVFAPRGTLLHTPAMAVHTGMACPDEDLVFFAMKDTRHGIVGPPVDGKYNGPNYLPGFGTRAAEPLQTTAQLMAACRGDTAGEKTRYIYDMGRADDKPGRVPSALLTSPLNLAAHSAATGVLVTGETLHVAVLQYPRGAVDPLMAHPNEQFSFVVDGELQVEVDGDSFTVGQHCVVHIPPDLPHRLSNRGAGEALVVTLQDTRHAFAG